MDLRRIWLQVHLWLGLTLGVVGALIGVTGSILVFDHEIDALAQPAALRGLGIAGRAELLRTTCSAQRRRVEGRARPTNLRLPEGEGVPVVVFARARGEGGG